MQKITTYLWYDNQAEEAAIFYTSIFKNSRVLEVNRYGDGVPMPAGTAWAQGVNATPPMLEVLRVLLHSPG